MTSNTYPDELPAEDRLRCIVDELVFGKSFVEMTDDGPRRRDPTEVTVQHE